MPEPRIDPLSGAWVLNVPGRAARPGSHGARRTSGPRPDWDPACPFCPGNEASTPPELGRVDGPGGWRARAFPNRFPIVEGAHEVIVLSPRHCDSLALMAPAQAAGVIRLSVERIRAQMAAGRRSVQLFVNHQPAAGSSLDHPHAQLVGLNTVPPAVARELDALHRDGCVLCAAIAGECLPGAPRAVLAHGELVAWCPAWSSAPYELLVAPRAHGSPFEDLAARAEALVGLLGSLDRAAGDPAYNLVAHIAPAGVTDFHWHLHVRPKLSEPGGFELGTGITVVELAPEAAALALRSRVTARLRRWARSQSAGRRSPRQRRG